MKRAAIILSLVLAASWMGNACAGKPTTRLDIVFVDGPQTSFTVGAKVFKKIVEQKTGGALSVAIHPSGRLGNRSYGELEIAHLVASGTAQAGIISSSPLDNYENEMSVIDIPFIFHNYAQVDHVLDGPVGKRLLDGLCGRGLRGLAFFDCGFRVFSTTRPVRKLEDFRNLRVRVMQSRTWVNLVKALHGVPVPSAVDKIHDMAARGYIDAADRSYPTYWDFKLYEVQKYITDTRHAYTAKVLIVNEKLFQSLTSAQQAALRQAALAARIPQRRAFRAEVQRVRKNASSRGVTIIGLSDAERQKFAHACKPVVDQITRVVGSDLVRRVEGTR